MSFLLNRILTLCRQDGVNINIINTHSTDLNIPVDPEEDEEMVGLGELLVHVADEED